jgi:hypothetical protein
MLHVKALSVVSKKVVSPRSSQLLQIRTTSVSRPKVNKVRFVPLPSTGNIYRLDLNTNTTESHTKYRYVGYSDRRTCVTSINTQQASQFNERLCNAAELYDGWFSRNVENLDLAPSISKFSSKH